MSGESDFAVAVGKTFNFRDPLGSATEIRQRWFESGALYFLFNKNLRVTNVQFTELLSLLRLHTHERGKKAAAKALYFITSDEFDQLVIEIAEPFEGEPHLDRALSGLYFEVFARTVIVDPYHGSCNVFVPPTLTVNLAAIAGEAAYLHSCGYSVFVRNMVKAEPTLLRDKLTEHLKRFPPQPKKRLRFLIYADEDFTARDRRNASSLRNGLDDAKIHVEKAWFRTERLVDVLNQLKGDLDDKLLFIDGKDYVADVQAPVDDERLDLTRTLWLVQDRALGEPSERPGDDRYYICYDQLYRTRNAIHIFDENKPAWQDHTTMPPSLAGALLNIVRAPGNTGPKLKVADPFVGTGTTLLEVLRFPDMSFHGSDVDETSKILVEDNLEFFWRKKKELNEIYKRFIDIKQELQDVRTGNTKFEDTDVFRIAKELFGTRRFARSATDPDKLRLRKDRLPGEQSDRLLAYVALRASKRNSARFARAAVHDNEDWLSAFQQELEVLTTQIEELKKLRKLKELDKTDERRLLEAHQHAHRGSAEVALLADGYSIACMPRAQVEKAAKAQSGSAYALKVGRSAGDARKLPKDTFDIIIGDPPYGFNTSKKANELAELYRGFAKTGLEALRDGGHLILCLPDRSHSGRYSPAFTHRSLVLQQLLLAAGEVDRQLVFPHDRVRGAAQLYEADYYWESERALRRTILHVQVRHAAKSVIEGEITSSPGERQ